MFKHSAAQGIIDMNLIEFNIHLEGVGVTQR